MTLRAALYSIFEGPKWSAVISAEDSPAILLPDMRPRVIGQLNVVQKPLTTPSDQEDCIPCSVNIQTCLKKRVRCNVSFTYKLAKLTGVIALTSYVPSGANKAAMRTPDSLDSLKLCSLLIHFTDNHVYELLLTSPDVSCSLTYVHTQILIGLTLVA